MSTEQHKPPILLWRAPAEPRPEPVALLTYGEHSFAIPYTMLGILNGFLACGGKGSNWLNEVANVRAAIDGICSQMGYDTSPPTPEQKAFHKASNMESGPHWPTIKDYAKLTGGAAITAYNAPGHVCPQTGRLAMTVAEAWAREDSPDRTFCTYMTTREDAAASGLDPWRTLDQIEAVASLDAAGNPTAYDIHYACGGSATLKPSGIVYMQRTKAEREAAGVR